MIDQARNETLEAPVTTATLVNGTYSGSDARDLVLALLNSAVSFHKLINLRSHVHTESPDAESCTRAAELTDARAKLDSLLSSLEDGSVEIRLRSDIELEIVERSFAR